MKKQWVKPQLDSLQVHMTEATTYTKKYHDEAWNGDDTAVIPGTDELVPHHVS